MKKALLFTSFICMMLSLCSCSKNGGTDTYFIHAVCFLQHDDGVEIHALCEKTGNDSNEYFVISQSADNLDNAAKKLSDRYRDCYFATCRLYIIDRDEDADFLKMTASTLCESNLFPSRSSIICTEKNKAKEFTASIKNEDEFEKLLLLADGKKHSVVRFFSRLVSGKDATVIVVEKTEKGTFKSNGSTLFTTSDGDCSNDR